MKQLIYIVTSTSVDEDGSYSGIVGTYTSLSTAVEKMRVYIVDEFDEIKEWWEDEEDDGTVEEQYQEWIDENYIDDEHTSWSYTDDDPVEHTYKIHSVEVDGDKGEMFALLCTRLDGIDNRTDVLGVYSSRDAADEALAIFEAENEDDGTYYEVTASVQKIVIKK